MRIVLFMCTLILIVCTSHGDYRLETSSSTVATGDDLVNKGRKMSMAGDKHGAVIMYKKGARRGSDKGIEKTLQSWEQRSPQQFMRQDTADLARSFVTPPPPSPDDPYEPKPQKIDPERLQAVEELIRKRKRQLSRTGSDQLKKTYSDRKLHKERERKQRRTS